MNQRKFFTSTASLVPDPMAFKVDGLSMDWTGLFAYAIPPWPLLDKMIQKIELMDCMVILIVPRWPSRAWFPILLSLLMEDALQLPLHQDLLCQHRSDLGHNNLFILQLTTLKLSCRSCRPPASPNLYLQLFQSIGDILLPFSMTTDGTMTRSGRQNSIHPYGSRILVTSTPG